MKHLKLFPKTFLVSMGLFLALIVLMHLLIYVLMPRLYLDQKQQEASESLASLEAQLKGQSLSQMRQICQKFSIAKNVNITLTANGRDDYFQGFQTINIVTDRGKSADVDVVKIADGQSVDPRSVILKQSSLKDTDGRKLSVRLLVNVEPVKQAKLATLHVLPYTVSASLLVALLFSYCYSRFITKPIRRMAKVTTLMQRLEKGVQYSVESSDEIGVLGRNINELYQSLWQMIRSLEQENKRISKLEKERLVLLRATSHELKTPLASLRIMLENMQLNIGEYQDRDRYLAESLAQVDRLTKMVNDVLKAGSLAENALRGEKKLRVDQIVAEVVDDYRLLAKARRVTCRLDLAPTFTKANYDMIHHVISNLISNAVHYSEVGSVVEVTCRQHRLVVINKCQPLTQAQLQRVFDPFYHTDSQMSPESDGSGVGLYIVKMLLEAKGLEHSFSPVKQGMSFTIYFP